MPTMIQIRSVPDDPHRTLKARAALSGQSLSDFLLAAIRKVATRRTEREIDHPDGLPRGAPVPIGAAVRALLSSVRMRTRLQMPAQAAP